MTLILFLTQAFIISLSGVMQPGPLSATAIAHGAKNRYAGIMIAIGHGIVELPLMILIILGMDTIFKRPPVKITIGFFGGVILMIMAWQMVKELKKSSHNQAHPLNKKPLLAGILLSAANPYFLLWWATIGLKLAIDAKNFSLWAFALFALVHWLCDAVWLLILSFASYKGADVLGPKGFERILFVCVILMGFFGFKFLFDSVQSLVAL